MSKVAIISQSAYKAYEPTFSEKKTSWRQCQIAYMKEYILKEPRVEEEQPIPGAMKKGLWFEERVIGANRDGTTTEFAKRKKKSANGEDRYKHEIDLQNLSDYAKHMIKDMGITILDVQPEWNHEDLTGHIDCIAEYKGEKVIVDIKYTETGENDQWNEDFQWGDPQRRDHTQPIHYVYMSSLIFGSPMPFYYLVFGKSEWIKWIKVEVSQFSYEEHIQNIDKFRKSLIGFNPEPCGMFNLCRKCPFKDNCDFKTILPELQTIEV